MKKILTYKGAVMTWECDSNRHMNVMYYVNKFEHAGRNFMQDMELNILWEKENVGIVVLEQRINYLKEVFEDDLLYVESSLLEVKNKTFTVQHDMYNRGNKEKVCIQQAVFVLFDKVKRKSMPIPDEIRVRLNGLIED